MAAVTLIVWAVEHADQVAYGLGGLAVAINAAVARYETRRYDQQRDRR